MPDFDCSRKPTLCVVTIPFPKEDPSSTANQVEHITSILQPLCRRIYLITGDLPQPLDDIEAVAIPGYHNMIYLQMVVAHELFKMLKRKKDIDLVILSLGMQGLLLPMLVAKGFRKKTILTPLGSSIRNSRAALRQWRSLPLNKLPFRMLTYISYEIGERCNHLLADRIGIEAENLIPFFGLGWWRNKVLPYSDFALDFNTFFCRQEYGLREDIVGYLGRFTPVKGIMNFVQAIPLIARQRPGLKFAIGGAGYLKGQIEHELRKTGLNGRVEMKGWIPLHETPAYYSSLKLLVMPSYSEGLPTTPLEAMACGTPVLATPVGGIPDAIKDGETGFIMEDNSPQSICRHVLRALDSPKIPEIIEKAQALVKEKYGYQAAVERSRQLLCGV